MTRQGPLAALSRLASAGSILPILLAALIIAMCVADPRFFGLPNITNILRNASALAIVACGQALVLIVGGFDLSVGATVALASEIAAVTMRWAAGIFPGQDVLVIALGVVAALGTGLLIGLVNGICVTVFRVSGFIVTLGSMSVTLGIALIITNGIPVYGLPQSFITEFGRARWLGVPGAAYVAIAVVLLLAFVQRRTLLGRYFYAIGGNVEAAVVSGVPTKRYQTVAYMISGLLASVTGLLLTALVGSGQASFGGDLMMLQSIAAAVIGGVSLHGGVGRVGMVALSALFLSVLSNSLNLLRVDSRIQPIFLGLILICAVSLDEIGRRRTVRE
nr:ABC transporter permease [Bradyrhizobium pachyrhizi]